jgi:ATP phosphoribosyltransferase regulatory subunit
MKNAARAVEAAEPQEFSTVADAGAAGCDRQLLLRDGRWQLAALAS